MNNRFTSLPDARKKQGSLAEWRSFFQGVKQRAKSASPPTNHILPTPTVQENLQTLIQNNQDFILWLGHASFFIRLSGKHFLFDPFLSERASPVPFAGPKRLVPPAVCVENLPHIDFILISHNHYDHFCLKTLKQIPNKSDCQIIVPLLMGARIRKLGFEHITELNWYDSHTLNDDLQSHILPAYHYSQRWLHDHNHVLWGSYAISNHQHTIYFGGDTTYGKEFIKIGQHLKKIDYALLGIGAYQPRRLMQHAHASPEEALQIAHHLQAKNMVAMHWGTIVLTPEPVLAPISDLEQAKQTTDFKGKIHVLPIGGHILLA